MFKFECQTFDLSFRKGFYNFMQLSGLLCIGLFINKIIFMGGNLTPIFLFHLVIVDKR